MWKNYLSIVLLLTGCMYIRPKQNSMSDLSQNEWAQALTEQQQAVVLDVRTQEEFESGYIPKAINIDIQMGQSFIDEINSLDKNKFYYVYCRSGARSSQAVQLMRELGFNDTFNLLGGILEWEGEVYNRISPNQIFMPTTIYIKLYSKKYLFHSFRQEFTQS